MVLAISAAAAVAVGAAAVWSTRHAVPLASVQQEPASGRGDPSTPASPPSTAAAPTGGDDLADIIEPQAAQLSDLLESLHAACPAARYPARPGGVSAVARCVEAAEAAIRTADLIRGTLESPAGASIPGTVRERWHGTLAEAAGTVREALVPVQQAVGGTLAGELISAAAFRDLSHLRDRIARMLSETTRSP